MPVPLRDDGRPGPVRHLLVFVHGFISSSKTWDPLLQLLRTDKEMSSDFDYAAFEYSTSVASLPVIRRLPAIRELGLALGAYLDRTLVGPDGFNKYVDATLVGHSLGGLVIQSYLAARLDQGKGRDLDRLRQVVQFATPNFGSQTLRWFRRFMSWFIMNPQEQALRLFSPESRAIHESIRDKIVLAKYREDHRYPLPFYCFWGQTDNIVPEASARGHFAYGEPIPGDHFSLHQPTASGADGYEAFKNSIRFPHGHDNVWEVEKYRYAAKVWPVPPNTQTLVHHGGKQRTVTHDNIATVVGEVTFSRNNHCRASYVLRYGTRNGGYLEPHISCPHVTSADKVRLYDDNGTDVYYEIDPANTPTATLTLRVLKGFDVGHRDYHMHLGRSRYCRHVLFDVDLSEYLTAGWTIRVPPTLYYHPLDLGDHNLCKNRNMLDPDPAHRIDARGIWSWDLEHVKEGVVDIVWNLDPPRTRDDQLQVIRLKPGEHALFGYGSLLSIASLQRTLGREYNGPFLCCEIEGWRRSWDVSMPQSALAFWGGHNWITPPRIVYLNIAPAPGRAVNGVVFVVTDEELRKFDEREWIYNRAPINTALRGVTVEGGTAWAYAAKPEHVFSGADSPSDAAVRASYLRIIEAGQRELGPTFAARYSATTDAVPGHLVVDDVRRNEVLGQ